MIITKLQGGLGNQLFQWAVSKNLSIKYNTDIYFETSYFSDTTISRVSKWEMELYKLNINIKTFPVNTFPVNTFPVIVDNFRYQEISDNSYLDGYWQSDKYFVENDRVIRECLKIHPDIKSYILNKYPILLSNNTVSMHIRRGDYVDLQDYHPIQPIDYYHKSYDNINEDDINVIVLSNDIEWCKENIHFKNITFIENETNIIDLYIMSLCKHNIISNSSFSWWGAWLNENINKKVIAPKIWFGYKSIFSDVDIIPKKWIRI